MKQLLFTFGMLFTLSASAQFPIGERTITYNDPLRSNRAIECKIYYPGVSAGNNVEVATGSFPVVVLGHGFAMGVNVYNNWWEEFVPEGYIFVLPTTEGSLIPAPDHEDFGLDLKFMAETMQTENGNAASPFYQHVSDRTGIMGHSMGGGATILGASGFTGADCIVGLAPAETSPSAVTAASGVTAPALILSGEDDSVTPPNDHHIPIYNALGSSCKTYVTIANGSHCYFANYNFNCAFGEIIPGSLSREDQLDLSYVLILPYLEYFLKDSCDEWDTFQSELSTQSNVESFINDCPNESPTIIDNGGTLESTNASNYQWYLDGQPLVGENSQTHTYSVSGSYQVGTINIGNCEVMSNEITVQVTDLIEANSEFHIQRNGSEIRISSMAQAFSSINISDLLGRAISSKSLEGQKQTTIVIGNNISPLIIQIRFVDGSRKTVKLL